MARINLLPWREAARQRRRNEFATAAGISLAAAAVLALMVHLFFEGRIDHQNTRNAMLKNEIASLQKKIKEIDSLEKTKQDLLDRMKVIQDLQESRPEIVHLFEELVIGIPQGVYLTQLQQNGRSIVVEGRAQSNARVSAFMKNVEQSEWIGNPQLQLIENKDKTGTGLSHFRLSFDQVRPKDDKDQTGKSA